jgi:hypothetical protein
MPFERVEEPLSSPDAFRRGGDTATLSAAAALLVLGFRLRGDEHALTARAGDAPSEREEEPPVIALADDDVERLAIPPLPATGERIDPRRAQSRWAEEAQPPRYPPGLPRDVIGSVADQFHENPSHLAAAQLFEACLRHPEELVRVAAASSHVDLTTDPRRPLEVLRRALISDDQLTRGVAATSLSHFTPEDPLLARLLVRGQLPEGGRPASTWILVHGTWGRTRSWWKPGGDFHEYFKAQVGGDLYSAPDGFSWSGGYSEAARAVGATSLLRWATDHQLKPLELIAHSHGGNVAMLATQAGLDLGELFLLSCPVHIPKYLPSLPQGRKIVSIHVHMDLVILADRGGQKFNLPGISEHVLPIWFDHFATHEPNVWEDSNVAGWL